MRIQDQAVRMTQRAVDDLIRAVEGLPPDKREWAPTTESRSALAQLSEVVGYSSFLIELLRDGKQTTPEAHAAGEKRHAQTAPSDQSFEELAQAARAGTGDLCSLISSFPDDRLEEELQLGFGQGMTLTMADCLVLHYWNATYHTGQVNYIQTILGDHKMH